MVELKEEHQRLSTNLQQSQQLYEELSKKMFAGKARKEAQSSVDYYIKEIKKIEEKIKELE